MTKYICYLLYNLIAKYLPKSNGRFSHGYSKKVRSYLASKFIAKIGKNVNIEKGAGLSKGLEIGDNSGVGINCFCQGTIIIGKDVMMGLDVLIYTIDHEHLNTDIPMRIQGKQAERAVIIEDDVWIGSRAIILPGVRIGKGSIIGAGAVVAKSIPNYSVVVGNPARVVKSRICALNGKNNLLR